MTYYSVKICGRKRKTPFKGSRHVVYKKLHSQSYEYNKKTACWQKKQKQNVLLLISIGDYKHTSFDIIIKRVFAWADFKNLVERSKTIEEAHDRIRNETIGMAVQQLRNNGHFGLASMLKHNTDVDYVAGGEYTWTDEQPADIRFTRFNIRSNDRLIEINSKREVPHQYSKYDKEQKKIEVD